LTATAPHTLRPRHAFDLGDWCVPRLLPLVWAFLMNMRFCLLPTVMH